MGKIVQQFGAFPNTPCEFPNTPRCEVVTHPSTGLFHGSRKHTRSQGGGGGAVLPYKRLIGMCRWMGSHFHDWIDHNGVKFLVELLEWGNTFSDLYKKIRKFW